MTRAALVVLLLASVAGAGELARAEQAAVRTARKAQPSVVAITIRAGKRVHSLTGVVVNAKGWILTVREPFVAVRDGPAKRASRIHYVGAVDWQPAQVVYDDRDSGVVLLEPDTPQTRKTLRPRAAADTQLGEWVLLCGNTFHAAMEESSSVSLGVVSGIVRDGERIAALHTSALVNPGVHGAPVMDLDGGLLGIAALRVTAAGRQTVVVPYEHVRARYQAQKKPSAPNLPAPVERRGAAALPHQLGLVLREAARRGSAVVVGVRAGAQTEGAQLLSPEQPAPGAKLPPPPDPVPGRQPGHDRSTGVVVAEDGLVLCPLRVTGWPGPSRPLTVDLPDGRSLEAELLGYDERFRIALLLVDAKGLAVLPDAPADAARAGRFAVALGYPHEDPKRSTPQLTFGLVSRTDALGHLHPAFRAVQTDAGVGGGNRGGPLVDVEGRLIGMLLDVNDTEPAGYVTRRRARYAANAGLGFALPMSSVRPLIARMRGGTVFRTPFLGVVTAPAPGGLEVVRVADKNSLGQPSAARAAGLKTGDLLVELAGTPLENRADLRRALSLYTIGDEVELTFLRDGRRSTVSVKLVAR